MRVHPAVLHDKLAVPLPQYLGLMCSTRMIQYCMVETD